ncbi:O-antigen ligase family protein [Vibrio sp. Of7-15]|uniref:O-antigen ligase family protein n=1 Tax=Vibrio sp. Of7-15 TaxID=2724879 RepID=UPI001EF2A96F|nr:O-antigen ligase family protein [Vibrio sp. Of7-15]MCG7498497.1 O-antigen ligase family protein [Vibrio sp. Of7-15]
MRQIERACFFSLLILLIWLPIPLASNRAWAWSIMEIWLAIQTLVLIAYYKGNLPWAQIKYIKWLLSALFLFQAWTLLQTVVFPLSILDYLSPQTAEIYRSLGYEQGSISLDNEHSFIALLKGISYALLALNCVLMITSSKRIKAVIIALVISAMIQAFYGAVLVLLDTKISPVFSFDEKKIATGSFVYKNHLANYLMLVLTMGIGLIISELNTTESGSWQVRIKRWLIAILSTKMLIRLCLIIMVIGLVMTRSRMGNTAFFSATIIGGIAALLFYKHRPRALTVLIISVLAIDTFIVGALFGLDKVKQRIVETSLQEESRDQVVIWSLDIIKDYPLTGTGAGSFYAIFPSYSHADVGFYDHAHNEYIQFMVESGIPATLLLGMAILIAIYQCIWTIRNRHSHLMKGTALGCLMAICGMLIHISVDFNLQPPANAATFILILVLAGISKNMPREPHPR